MCRRGESSPSRCGVVSVVVNVVVNVVVFVCLLSCIDRLLFLALYLSVSYRINPVLKIRRLSWPCEESRKKNKNVYVLGLSCVTRDGV